MTSTTSTAPSNFGTLSTYQAQHEQVVWHASPAASVPSSPSTQASFSFCSAQVSRPHLQPHLRRRYVPYSPALHARLTRLTSQQQQLAKTMPLEMLPTFAPGSPTPRKQPKDATSATRKWQPYDAKHELFLPELEPEPEADHESGSTSTDDEDSSFDGTACAARISHPAPLRRFAVQAVEYGGLPGYRETSDPASLYGSVAAVTASSSPIAQQQLRRFNARSSRAGVAADVTVYNTSGIRRRGRQHDGAGGESVRVRERLHLLPEFYYA